MSNRIPSDVTFPVTFCGGQHYGVRFGFEALPVYFSRSDEAEVHLDLMIYRRQHGGEMPVDMKRFIAERTGQRRGDRAP